MACHIISGGNMRCTPDTLAIDGSAVATCHMNLPGLKRAVTNNDVPVCKMCMYIIKDRRVCRKARSAQRATPATYLQASISVHIHTCKKPTCKIKQKATNFRLRKLQLQQMSRLGL